MKRAVRLYALITQFIFTMIAGGLVGYFVGDHFDKEGDLNVILAAAGLGLAFFVNIIMIYQFMRNDKLVNKDDDDK